MVKKILILFVAFYVFIPYANIADASSDLQKLDAKTDEILQMVKVQRYDLALKLLDSFSANFLDVTASENVFTNDEFRIVYSAYEELMQKMKDPDAEHNEKVNSATKLRLVVDAVHTDSQPLWTNMEEQMMGAFQDAIRAAGEHDEAMFESELDRLLEQYDLIYASLQVDFHPETVQMLDSKFYYIDQYRPQVYLNGVEQQELAVLKYEMQSLFDEMEEDEADPSLWWVIISTGSVIITTLSYVGWKKYRGSKEGLKYKNKQKD
ncbi:sporulation protein YpjB [Bacillus sp. AGMB 02131]|uniref:Sporulation protein YpjB n=1 Tax=Peribacillus faecalis TaxID=2772559 RepID=A0A927HD78_9BACI|nr:sporulation protein YpjB [Peribacillus faecalis]MBD3110407.1 sporulation protein YpjB [Peribacillus faecalis]